MLGIQIKYMKKIIEISKIYIDEKLNYINKLILIIL